MTQNYKRFWGSHLILTMAVVLASLVVAAPTASVSLPAGSGEDCVVSPSSQASGWCCKCETFLLTCYKVHRMGGVEMCEGSGGWWCPTFPICSGSPD
jgi:hypothetical protein